MNKIRVKCSFCKKYLIRRIKRKYYFCNNKCFGNRQRGKNNPGFNKFIKRRCKFCKNSIKVKDNKRNKLKKYIFCNGLCRNNYLRKKCKKLNKKPKSYKKVGSYNLLTQQLEHRVIIEGLIKRKLKFKEVVHHINGKRNDNRKENLMVFLNKGMHKKYEFKKLYLLETLIQLDEIKLSKQARLKINKLNKEMVIYYEKRK